MATSLKEQCFAIIGQVIDREGPGTSMQIEYEELASEYGGKPNDAVWGEFLVALQNDSAGSQ